MTLWVSWVLCACHLRPGKLPLDSFCFSPMWVFWEYLHLSWHHPPLAVPQKQQSTLGTSVLLDEFDALLFMQFSHLHLLFSGHGVPDCPGVLITHYFPCEGSHLGLCWLTFGLHNMDGLHWIALLYDHLAKIRHCCVKICAIFFFLGYDNIDCCLWLNTLDSLERVTTFDAIIHPTVAIICKVLHCSILFLVECDILVPTSSFLLANIVRTLQLFFLLLQPVWLHCQGWKIAYEHWCTLLYCPMYAFFGSHLHKYLCLWRSLRGFDTSRHC